MLRRSKALCRHLFLLIILLYCSETFFVVNFSLPTLVPVTVSDEPKSVYYDPNPGKTRKAHTQQTTRNTNIVFIHVFYIIVM